MTTLVYFCCTLGTIQKEVTTTSNTALASTSAETSNTERSNRFGRGQHLFSVPSL